MQRSTPFFVFSQNRFKSFQDRGKTLGFTPSELLHMQKQIALPPSRCNLRKPEGYTLEVYYEDNKEDGLQEAPSYRKEQSDRQLRCWMPLRKLRRLHQLQGMRTY